MSEIKRVKSKKTLAKAIFGKAALWHPDKRVDVRKRKALRVII